LKSNKNKDERYNKKNRNKKENQNNFINRKRGRRCRWEEEGEERELKQ
jgi:hypothetical protein